MCSALNPPLLAFCIHTHGEADHLVVPGRLGFLHWLHERPGVLVTLRHIKHRLVRIKHVYASRALCTFVWRRPLTFTCWRMVFRVLYSWSGSFSSFLKHGEHKQVGQWWRARQTNGRKGLSAKLESESHTYPLPTGFQPVSPIYAKKPWISVIPHTFKINMRYYVRKIYGAM